MKAAIPWLYLKGISTSGSTHATASLISESLGVSWVKFEMAWDWAQPTGPDSFNWAPI